MRSWLCWCSFSRSMNWNINNDSFIFFSLFLYFRLWLFHQILCFIFKRFLFYHVRFSLCFWDFLWFKILFNLICDICFSFINFRLNRRSGNNWLLAWYSNKALDLILIRVRLELFLNISDLSFKRLTILDHFLSCVFIFMI